METIMEKEIHSQAVVLNNTYENNIDKIQALAKLIKSRKLSHIAMAARGSSDNACLYFKYLCEIVAGIPVTFIHPSILTFYQGKLDPSNMVLICVSQSGAAFDIRNIMEMANKRGGITVSITNNEDSPLAREAQIHLFMDVEKEQSMAATKTFTAEMLILGMLVKALANQDEYLPPKLDFLPKLINETMALKPQIELLSDKWVNIDQAFVLSRGINLSVAREICCKIQETCFLNASSYAISDFLHGPFAMVSSETRVMLIAMNNEMVEDTIDIIEKLHEIGAKIILFTDNIELPSLVDDALLLPKSDMYMAPFVSTVAGQLFSCLLSLKRGLNPDKSRNIKKITITK